MGISLTVRERSASAWVIMYLVASVASVSLSDAAFLVQEGDVVV